MRAVEWLNQNKYNSFNSYKGLTYFEHYKKILGWFDGKNELPPPIEASLDPYNGCNNSCYYCNSQRYLRENPAHLLRWGRDYIEDLLIELARWGVKACCWGGGGEATLNIRLAEMNRLVHTCGMDSAIITNGVLLSDDLIDSLMLCRWIGVSMDSAHPAAYKSIRGTDDCLTVLNNVKKLVAKRTRTDIAIKCLVLPQTIDTLYYTCQVAREIGVQDFHVRPVDLWRKDFKPGKSSDIDPIRLQHVYEGCHALETEGFHVYTVAHKFTQNLRNRENDFKCMAAPLILQVCTDKRVYSCIDHRLEERFCVGDVKGWGSDKHRQLLQSIDPKTECARCTMREYQKQIEAVKNDTMCREFP